MSSTTASAAPLGRNELYRAGPGGFRVYLVLWLGQTVSLLGSNLSRFALGVWVYQLEESVTQFALISLFATLPGVFLSPLAGALVDRWNRRWAMILSDAIAAASTVALALLFALGVLEVWHIYVTTAVSAIAGAFQWPAYSSATTLLVAKRDFSRAAGLRNLSQSLVTLVAPVLGAAVLVAGGLWTVIVLDLVTFLIALASLMWLTIPDAPPSEEGSKGAGSLFGEAWQGWRYLRQRPGLLGFLFTATAANFAMGLVTVLAPPLVLSFASVTTLGTLVSIGGVGALVGAVITTVWRSPKRRLEASLGWQALCGVAMVLAGLRPSVVAVGVGVFLYYFGFSLSGAYGQAIWQSKIAPDIQGRVFAIRRMVGWASFPVAYALAGPLAERVFEPLMVGTSDFATRLTPWVGHGEGRGIALMMVLTGIGFVVVNLAAFLFPRIRRLEQEIPDTVDDAVDTADPEVDAVGKTDSEVDRVDAGMVGDQASALAAPTTEALGEARQRG